MPSKKSNSSDDKKKGKSFYYNSYAKAVNSTGQLARRHQSIDKINEYGMGVIYVWDWQWSFSNNLYDKGLENPEQAKYGRSNQSEDGAIRSSGRFMYLGLSIQQPTSNRMAEHIAMAKERTSVEYAALGQGIYNTFGSEPYRKFENPMDVPKIIHISSLFDLATLEEHFITRYALAQTQKVYNNFEELVSDYSGGILKNSKLSGVTGVNTAGGGQGGPLKGITWRGPREWIMAAYFFLKEKDNTILESRNSEMDKIYRDATTKKMVNGKMVSKTTDEQILSVVQGFLGVTGSNIVAPKGITIKILQEIDLPVIQNTITSLGVRDKDLTSRQFDAKLNKDGTLESEKATSDDFNINIKGLTYENGSLGFVLSENLTVEMRPGDKKTGVRKLIAGKTEGGATKVKAEFRDMIFSNILDSIPKDPAKIESYSIQVGNMLNNLDDIAEAFFTANYDFARIKKQIAESRANIEKTAKETEKKMLVWSKKIAELKAKIFIRNTIEQPTSRRVGFKLDSLKSKPNELKEHEQELAEIMNNMAEEIHIEERKVANAIIEAGKNKKKVKADKTKN